MARRNPVFAPPAIQYNDWVYRPGVFLQSGAVNPLKRKRGASLEQLAAKLADLGAYVDAEGMGVEIPGVGGVFRGGPDWYVSDGGEAHRLASGRSSTTEIAKLVRAFVAGGMPEAQSVYRTMGIEHPGSRGGGGYGSNPPKSKLCRQGRHDFDAVTGACRRKDCMETLTRPMFGGGIEPGAAHQRGMFALGAASPEVVRCKGCGEAVERSYADQFGGHCPGCVSEGTWASNPPRVCEPCAQGGHACYGGDCGCWCRQRVELQNPPYVYPPGHAFAGLTEDQVDEDRRRREALLGSMEELQGMQMNPRGWQVNVSFKGSDRGDELRKALERAGIEHLGGGTMLRSGVQDMDFWVSSPSQEARVEALARHYLGKKLRKITSARPAGARSNPKKKRGKKAAKRRSSSKAIGRKVVHCETKVFKANPKKRRALSPRKMMSVRMQGWGKNRSVRVVQVPVVVVLKGQAAIDRWVQKNVGSIWR